MSGTRIVNPANDTSLNAIQVRGVVKSFKKNTIRREYTTFKSELLRLLRPKKGPSDGPARRIEALRNISLDIPRGKTVGILGRNGSGKSTLLKLITGIYTPTAGSIEVNGRISALLDLGAGFHPDFSGRENILINGIILGMSRSEVRARMDEIIAYSELGDFIDEPVRTYSSGMFMRLAFAVATHVDPEILIIDEILAVGDEHFGKKSRAKMDEFKKAGKTIVLVTHDLGTVEKWCDLAAWIDGGHIRRVGPPSQVVAEYRQAVTLAEEQSASFTPHALSDDGGALPAVPQRARPLTGPQVGQDARSGSWEVEISGVQLLDGKKSPSSNFDTESALELQLDYVLHEALDDVGFGVSLRRSGGELVYETSTFVDALKLPLDTSRTGRLFLRLDRLGLLPGDYTVDVFARRSGGHELDHHRGLYRFSVTSTAGDLGMVRLPHTWSVVAGEPSAAALTPDPAPEAATVTRLASGGRSS